MAIKLTIKNTDSTANVSISINVNTAVQAIDFKNTAMQTIQNMNEAVNPKLPFLTYNAIESACISGGIFARKKLGIKGLAIELLSFSLNGNIENAEPFAIATMVAACKMLSNKISFSESDMSGWCEVE